MSQESDGTALVDASVPVRYPIDNARAGAKRVRQLPDGGPVHALTEGTIAETASVLTSVYGVQPVTAPRCG